MVIVGMFSNRTEAETAIRDLKTSGFSDERIGIAMQERTDQQATSTGTNGSILGGLIGLLGTFLVPGVGPVSVGGMLASALARAGMGTAAGDLCGTLTKMRIPERDAKYFETGLHNGKVLIAVNAFTRSDDVLDILRERHADFGPSGTTRYTPVQATWGYAGQERRLRIDPNYVGMERRMATA